MSSIDEQQVWAAIDRGVADGSGAPDALYNALVRDASDEQLLAVQANLSKNVRRLNTWRHRAAACVMLGPISEMQFVSFGYWAMGHGHGIYERIVDDPDALADLALPETQPHEPLSFVVTTTGEVLGDLIVRIWMNKYWRKLDASIYNDPRFEMPDPLPVPAGKPYTDEASLRRDLPAICHRFPEGAAAVRLAMLQLTSGDSPAGTAPEGVSSSFDDLVVDILVPLNIPEPRPDGYPFPFLDRVEEVLRSDPYHMGVEFIDDGEEVGDYYIYSIGGADEQDLLMMARGIAGMEDMADGLIAIVTTRGKSLSGEGRRVPLVVRE